MDTLSDRLPGCTWSPTSLPPLSKLISSSLAVEDTAASSQTCVTTNSREYQLGEHKHASNVNLHESRDDTKEYSDSESCYSTSSSPHFPHAQMTVPLNRSEAGMSMSGHWTSTSDTRKASKGLRKLGKVRILHILNGRKSKGKGKMATAST